MAASRGIGIGTMNESHSTAVWLCGLALTTLLLHSTQLEWKSVFK